MYHKNREALMMTYSKAIKHIRKYAPEVEETFKTICRNRYCNPVRKWSIHDIAKRKKLSSETAKHRYNRHLKRLYEIFGVPPIGY